MGFACEGGSGRQQLEQPGEDGGVAVPAACGETLRDLVEQLPGPVLQGERPGGLLAGARPGRQMHDVVDELGRLVGGSSSLPGVQARHTVAGRVGDGLDDVVLVIVDEDGEFRVDGGQLRAFVEGQAGAGVAEILVETL
ncbi:hypothetical protein [Nocardia cyriacigeorgica]|uniref:hypothetical protein n=1 Tax=Nocardia cyriacigeorgica TaxID=135487 RepID=UPI0014873521|nr:hypothetical protein [Nocardia cyriacigeorgica]